MDTKSFDKLKEFCKGYHNLNQKLKKYENDVDYNISDDIDIEVITTTLFFAVAAVIKDVCAENKVRAFDILGEIEVEALYTCYENTMKNMNNAQDLFDYFTADEEELANKYGITFDEDGNGYIRVIPD